MTTTTSHSFLARLLSSPSRSLPRSSSTRRPLSHQNRIHFGETRAAAARRGVVASSSIASDSTTSSTREEQHVSEKQKCIQQNFIKGRGLDIDVRPESYEDELREKISRAKSYFLKSVFLPDEDKIEIFNDSENNRILNFGENKDKIFSIIKYRDMVQLLNNIVQHNLK
mgnify:CR=1 FL=1